MVLGNCAQCGAPATVYVLQMADGVITQQPLCAACALRRGLGKDAKTLKMLSANFFRQLLGDSLGQVVCPNCGLTVAKFQEGRLLGCHRCYAAFSKFLAPLFDRMQHSPRHRGKRFRPAEDGIATENGKTSGVARRGRLCKPIHGGIRMLQSHLRLAVAVENYEEAAAIRDRLAAVRRRKKPTRSVAVAALTQCR